MATILGIESTCDETAAAVVVDGFDVRSNVVASQVELHARYRGVVPEIASRAHIENILPVIREATDPALCLPHPRVQGRGEGELREGGFSGIDAIAVAYRPGLIGSLLIGVTAAKTLAWALGKPLIGVDHVHAHLYSAILETNLQPPMPAVGLVCSGGHTALYHVKTWFDVTLIGSTIDDAVGEAYDKVSAILNLGYPGGPVIDRLAATGDPAAIKFPRTLLDRQSLDFSFSGLKTAVLYHVRGVPRRGEEVKSEPARKLGDHEITDIAAGFQAACIDVITEKLRRAVARVGARSVIIGGGVSANQGLRTAMKRFGVPVFFPPLRYCTDNAAMSAGLAQVYFDRGEFSDLSLDAVTFSKFIGAV
jgi:N6-L-threonylcarbamoyladenine synthase